MVAYIVGPFMLVFFKLSYWKKQIIKKYYPEHLIFIDSTRALKRLVLRTPLQQLTVAVWASTPNILNFTQDEFFKTHPVKILRIEDGFIRSNGLGSKYFYPYSLVFDDLGIYYNCQTPSRLEVLLNTFNTRTDQEELKAQSRKLISKIIELNITKYAQGPQKTPIVLPPQLSSYGLKKQLSTIKLHGTTDQGANSSFELRNQNTSPLDHLSNRKEVPNFANTKPKVILIPGQVETDASVITSGCGYDSLKLLQEVRRKNPLSFIIFKIHPDVLFSSRQGIANRKELLKFANYVCSDNTPITTLIELADEVHTISSLSGFDALIRGKKIFTYGMPFYAGWGLTTDQAVCPRRTAKLTLEALVACALILYPKYYNWHLDQPTDALTVCSTLAKIASSEQNRIMLLGDLFLRIWRKLGLHR